LGSVNDNIIIVITIIIIMNMFICIKQQKEKKMSKNRPQHTYTPLLSTVVVQHTSPSHTLWGCAGELASALTAATILADASVTPPSLK